MTTIYPHLTVYDVGSCLCIDYSPNTAISHNSNADISTRHLTVCSVAAFIRMSAFGCGIWLDCACSAFDTSYKYVCVCVCVDICSHVQHRNLICKVPPLILGPLVTRFSCWLQLQLLPCPSAICRVSLARLVPPLILGPLVTRFSCWLLPLMNAISLRISPIWQRYAYFRTLSFLYDWIHLSLNSLYYCDSGIPLFMRCHPS